MAEIESVRQQVTWIRRKLRVWKGSCSVAAIENINLLVQTDHSLQVDSLPGIR